MKGIHPIPSFILGQLHQSNGGAGVSKLLSRSHSDPEPAQKLHRYSMSQHSLKWALPELRSKSHLDGIHDPVGKDGHLARDSLHSLLELGDVWASGKDAVKA